MKTDRNPEHKILDLILNRHSPRAMSGEKLSNDELMTLFEAAKWAPSSFNEQPWRFLYAKRETQNWDLFFNLLGDFNKMWCKNASVLVVVVSKKTFAHNNTHNVVHSFDSGSAWENLALQASSMNLVTHGMAGFDYDKAKKDLNIPDDFKVEAMVAIGKPGKKEDLPEALQKNEIISGRKMLNEIVFEGKFKI